MGVNNILVGCNRIVLSNRELLCVGKVWYKRRRLCLCYCSEVKLWGYKECVFVFWVVSGYRDIIKGSVICRFIVRGKFGSSIKDRRGVYKGGLGVSLVV